MAMIKLERGNDWGADYLAIKALTDRGTCSFRELRHPFAEGSSIQVKWPDKTVESVVVKHKAFSTVVSDHGHSNTVSFHIPGFEANMHGHTFWLALDEVAVSEVSLGQHRDWVRAQPQRDPNGR